MTSMEWIMSDVRNNDLMQLRNAFDASPDMLLCEIDRVTITEHAIDLGRNEVIDLLAELNHGDVDGLYMRRANTPMIYAANHGNDPMIETLVRAGSHAFSPSTYDWRPLYQASMFAHSPTIYTIVRLSGGQDIDEFVDYLKAHPSMDVIRYPCLKALAILGISQELFYVPNAINAFSLGVLKTDITEDERVQARFAVYFRHSLSYRLFLKLDALRFSMSPRRQRLSW